MGSLFVALIVMVVILFVWKITGIFFRLIVLIALAAFLYYLYTTGFHTVIIAPGTDVIGFIA